MHLEYRSYSIVKIHMEHINWDSSTLGHKGEGIKWRKREVRKRKYTVFLWMCDTLTDCCVLGRLTLESSTCARCLPWAALLLASLHTCCQGVANMWAYTAPHKQCHSWLSWPPLSEQLLCFLTEGWADSQTDLPIDRQTDSHSDTQTGIHSVRQTDSQRQTDI